MMKQRLFRIARTLIIAGVLIFAFPFIWRLFIVLAYGSRISTIEEAEPVQVAVVFGGGIHGNGRPSDVLRDRLDTAVALYEAGKVERLLLTGDNSSENYNEPGVMLNYVREQGVPFEHIQPDYGGRRTYDSCYRAKYIFGLEDAILVTQQFHLPRALFLCRGMGINASGVPAYNRGYIRMRWFQIREIGATLQAPLDLLRNNPAPVMGQPIVID